MKSGQRTYSRLARCFDKRNSEWRKDAEYNLKFLMVQQDKANYLLKDKGYLFLNEVYKMLGFPETWFGQIVGWIYDPKNPIRNNKVDFGIHDVYNKRHRAFVNGYERNIIIDFNVDGCISNNI